MPVNSLSEALFFILISRGGTPCHKSMLLWANNWLISTFSFQNNTLELDFDYFVCLCEQYYLSDDPSDLGNFINGRLEFKIDDSKDDDSDDSDDDPGLVDHRANSSTSIHSMDDDLNNLKKPDQLKKSKSVIRLHEHKISPVKRIYHTCCCIL